ncbi:NAD-dependent malic enzyme, mitochondrial [Steccherinum ochraceum]|uniref:Malic enzyme n=1 Tax=Steccherinum ochraceum TaxID=92696 RepID=A0A4R0RP55_9APHY|nr:NAD-dependent malic enzyme, mitochondrial [Steccherinum ochraceum]
MTTEPVFRVALRGGALLTSPRWNKGTAFSAAERKAFGLIGRLPHKINSLDDQCNRAYDQLCAHENDLRKNTFLQSMKDQNWVLYYALIGRHLRELMPIIYTPTEADAIANYSHLFRRSEGLYLTFTQEDTMEEDFLEQTKGRDIDLVVCSDAEAILGIGDQGVGGIGIASAKSTVYTLLAGMDPSKTLSVTLDVGTNNQDLLKDPLYVGWPHERVRGDDYDRFIDKFVQLVRKNYPHSLLHFEDFGVTNANRLLERYREQHTVFNDDVQGTGAVTLACIMSAVGVTKSRLADQRFVIYGAGSAGLGITRQLRDGLVNIDNLSVEEANKRFYLLDKFGLVRQSLGPSKIRDALHEFVRSDEEWSGVAANDQGEIGLLEVVKKVKPTVLIGCSTHAGAFTEDVVRAMAKGTDRPIILPLSNPSRLHEVKPQDANDWTDGKALLATGSPFPPCKQPGGKEYIVAECNNALIYPGLGFGAVLAQSRTLTDTMIISGTRRLASLAPALKDPDDALLPDFGDAPAVNLEVAIAVAEQAIDEGSAGVSWKKEDVRERAKAFQWRPIYGTYEYNPEGAQE